jgi:hypothetical protein
MMIRPAESMITRTATGFTEQTRRRVHSEVGGVAG